MSAEQSNKFDQLAALKREADSFDFEAHKRTSAAKSLASMRNNDRSMLWILENTGRHDHHGIPKRALEEVLEEFRTDILRIAEMRLTAEARHHKVAAAQKIAVIHASIIVQNDGEAA